MPAGLCHPADLAARGSSGKYLLSLAITGWWGCSSLLYNFATEISEQKQALNSILMNIQEISKQTRVTLINKEVSTLSFVTATSAFNERFTPRQIQRYSRHQNILMAGPASHKIGWLDGVLWNVGAHKARAP